MPYGLVLNGQLRDLADIKYLLSPQVTFSSQLGVLFHQCANLGR